jgi:hypothetical protein
VAGAWSGTLDGTGNSTYRSHAMNEETATCLTPNDGLTEHKYKLIDYFIKRLEHTIAHTQTATKLIYLVNGAILAAVYFEFGKVRPMSAAFLVGGVLTLLLCIVNFLHANFMAIQNAWYRTIDQEIRTVFLSLEGLPELWPKHLGESLDDVLRTYETNYRIFLFKRTHQIYVWLHLVVALFLLLASVAFFVMSWHTPAVTLLAQWKN